jgi:hypothetical protein
VDPTLQTIAFLLIMLVLVSIVLASAVVRRQRGVARKQGIAPENVFPLRNISAYDVLPEMVGQAVEADRPILISTGGSQIGAEGTVMTLAALSLAYYTTQEMAIGQTSPILMTNQSLLVPLGFDMMQRAYSARGFTPRTDIASVRWYGTLQQRSLVFAAMLTVTMQSEDVTGSVLLGNFGAEIGLALGAAQRKQVQTIAGSDNIIGQAVAYGMGDNAMVGEDIFSPAGYLGGNASERGSLIAQDFLRGVVITAIVVVALAEVAGDQIGAFLSGFGG